MKFVPSTKKHKVKKGDTLEGLAKKYGHKKWKPIWNAPENKKLVKQRGQPEKIEPGDVLFIPLSDKETKALQAEVDKLHESREADAALLKTCEGELARIDTKLKRYDQLIKSHMDSTKKIIAELEKNLAGMKKWGSGVDVAAQLIGIGRGLAKLGKIGYDASKASGEALKKLNDEALKAVIDTKKGQAKDMAVTLASSLKENKSTTLAVIGIVADSYSKMTSPSFWANTWMQLTENGKSWSEAVTMEVGDDIKQRIKQVKAQSDKLLKQLQQQRKKEEDLKKQLSKNIAGVKKNIRSTEAQVDKLPAG